MVSAWNVLSPTSAQLVQVLTSSSTPPEGLSGSMTFHIHPFLSLSTVLLGHGVVTICSCITVVIDTAIDDLQPPFFIPHFSFAEPPFCSPYSLEAKCLRRDKTLNTAPKEWGSDQFRRKCEIEF